MVGYRIVIFSTVLAVSLSAAAIESIDSLQEEQGLLSVRYLQGKGLLAAAGEAASEETSTGEKASTDEEAAHHHHHEHPAEADTQIKSPPAEEAAAEGDAAATEETHHHHHEHPAEADTQIKSPPAEEAAAEGDAAATEETHHHHHEHPAEADTQLKPPPAEEAAEHIHHEFHHEHHMMVMDAGGMVMNENKDDLPRDCPRLAGDVEFTVRAGTKYAKAFPGTMFGYDQHEWKVEPCTRVTITLINEDDVRHQWMMHMLPKYIYPQGMFHLEVAGKGRRTGTFIVPSAEKTYFVHCDIAQHTEKGMKAQLKVGRGDQDFPSIPGITAPKYPDFYETEFSWSTLGSSLGAGAAGLVLAILGWDRIQRRRIERVKEAQQPPPPSPTPTLEPKRRKWWYFT